MTTVSDYLLERLSAWGVRRIFGYPGDGINGIMGAFGRQEAVQFIQVRHEEMAAFMACGHAKFTGEVGVCLATSGPGAIHLLNGLYDAQMDRQPVVAIVGQQKRRALGGDYQQEVDLMSLFKDVAKDFVHMAVHPAQVRHLVDRAMRIALSERTVTCLIFPADIQEEKAQPEQPHKHATVHSGVGWSRPRVLPQQRDLERAADVLNAGKKVAMLIGAGAAQAQEEVLQASDILGTGIAKALLGRALLDDRLPQVTGAIGLLGTKPSWVMMSECDTFFMIGSSFPYPEFLPKEGQARGVQIDIDGRMLSIRYPMEVNLAGDAKETLRALLPMLHYKQDRSWRQRLELEVRDWWKVLEARARNEADPLNPQRVFWELSKRLPDGCIITADSGSGANWYARDLRLRPGMLASLSGNLATMGCAVPYALAAKFAYPDRPVLAIAGDGAMQMNGINELITAAKYWRTWSDPRWLVLVLNNLDLNQVTWEQRVLAGNPKLKASQDLPDFRYAAYAESLGFRSFYVEDPDDLEAMWDEAVRTPRPVLVEARVDPNVVALPPHITFEQAKSYWQAIMKGDPDTAGILKMSFRDMIESYLPHRGIQPQA